MLFGCFQHDLITTYHRSRCYTAAYNKQKMNNCQLQEIVLEETLPIRQCFSLWTMGSLLDNIFCFGQIFIV